MDLSSKGILNPSTDGTCVLDLLGDGEAEKPLINHKKVISTAAGCGDE